MRRVRGGRGEGEEVRGSKRRCTALPFVKPRVVGTYLCLRWSRDQTEEAEERTGREKEEDRKGGGS